MFFIERLHFLYRYMYSFLQNYTSSTEVQKNYVQYIIKSMIILKHNPLDTVHVIRFLTKCELFVLYSKELFTWSFIHSTVVHYI